ncbi:MAG: hypothetical protein Q9218_003143 [Villophora microphyllina]
MYTSFRYGLLQILTSVTYQPYFYNNIFFWQNTHIVRLNIALLPKNFYIRIPPLSSVYLTDTRVPDVGADYTRLRGPRRHTWTREEKQVLCTMNEIFDNPSAELWEIFGAYFAEKYRYAPRPRKRAWLSMKSHLIHLVKHRKGWTQKAPLRIKNRLVNVASRIGIRLHTKPQNTPVKSSAHHRKRAPSADLSTTALSGNDWSSDSSESLNVTAHDLTPQARRAVPVSGLLTPPPTQKKSTAGTQAAQMDRPIPPIAFRAFDKQSQGLNGSDGFVAGSFVSGAMKPSTPGETQYIGELERHLARQHSGPTPFVSVCQNLMRVIHHTIRRDRFATAGQTSTWKLAIISLANMPGSVRAVWDLDAGEHSRKAYGEWVVWGNIPSANVLGIVSMDDILSTIAQTSSPFHVDKVRAAKYTSQARQAMAIFVKRGLDYNDGLQVGRVLQLLGISKRHLSYATHNILADWRYPEYRNDAWLSNTEFVRGLNVGYHITSSGFLTTAIDNAREGQSKHHSGDLVRAQYSGDDQHTAIDNADFYPRTPDHTQTTLDTNKWLGDFLTELEDVAFPLLQPGKPAPGGLPIKHVNNDPVNGFVLLESATRGT